MKSVAVDVFEELEKKLRSSAAIGISGGSRPYVWGGSQIGGRQKVFNCLTAQGCLRRSLSITQKWSSRKWLFLFVKLCDLSENNHSSKTFYTINSENA